MYYLANLTYSKGAPLPAEHAEALNPRESINHSNFLPFIKNHTQA